MESHIDKTIYGGNPKEPAKDFREQTYMVMSPIRKMSIEEDVWFNIFDQRNGKKLLGHEAESSSLSDGSTSTYSFSQNLMRQKGRKRSCEQHKIQKKVVFHPLWQVPICFFILVVLIAGNHKVASSFSLYC